MNLNAVMARMTLRQMETAAVLWRADVGPDGPSLQQALQGGDNYRAMAAMVAAKLRLNGHPDLTIDEAMDLELDAGDDVGEANGGSGGIPPLLSPATGR